MAFNNLVAAHNSSVLSDTISVAGNFTSPTDLNLLIAKSTRIEIYLMTADGLQPIKEICIYGRIASMFLFRSETEKKDLLFLLTSKHNVAILECVRVEDSFKVITRAQGNVTDSVSKPVDSGTIGMIDPNGKVFGLRLDDGSFKVIPLESDNKELKAFNIRMEELNVSDIQFLHGCQTPTIAFIHQDKTSRHLKTYEISLAKKQFTKGPWKQDNIEPESSILIPVPMPYGGALIIGQESIVYLNGENKYCAIAPPPISQSTITSYCKVDASRYLLGDMSGRLFMLNLRCDEDLVRDLKLELLGNIAIPECLTYLQDGLVYVASRMANSQLIKLNLEPNDNGSRVDILKTFNNIAPIVDSIVIDLDLQGQGQLITCSGAYKEGSLRISHNGMDIQNGEDRFVPKRDRTSSTELRHNVYRSVQSVPIPKPMADIRQRKSPVVRSRSQSVDCQSMGGIFDIDLEIEDNNTFDSNSYSDEEEEDGSDDSVAFRNSANQYNSLNRGRNIPNTQSNAQNQSMAYSLPIQVPKWKNFHRHNDSLDDDNVAMIPNGEAIGESIKKLAKSVRNDSEIFGDRPRRRTNTLVDLIKSRPQ